MVEVVTAAEEARRWADLAGNPRVAEPKPPRTGLENREPAGPDEISPEAHFAAYAARLLAEPCE